MVTMSTSEEISSDNQKVKKVATIINKLLQASHNESEEILSKSKSKREIEEEFNDDERISSKRAENKHKKIAMMKIGRSYPDIEFDYEKERKLKIMGTQGVVQLFSTIEKYKRQVHETLSDKRTEYMKAKALEDKGEDAFMKLLDKEGMKANIPKHELNTSSYKKEIKSEDEKNFKSGWNVLAKNFYDDTTLTNWDQNDDSDEG